jgi:type IV pilus assembly protein PilN
MIRINLLSQERLKKPAVPLLDPSRRVPLGAALIAVLTLSGVGWWYWSLTQTDARLDEDIATTQQQADRMKPVLAEVQTFEARRTVLQQRVALIEQLRGGQNVPVQLLDAVSRSVPDSLWLTQLDQQKNEMTIEGRAATLIALSDFVGNLGESALLLKPIEIVSSQVETVAPPTPQGLPADVIKFTVKVQLAPLPGATPAVTTVAAVAGGAR